MGIVFKFLNWPIKCYALENVHVAKDGSHAVVQSPDLYTVFGINKSDWTVSEWLTVYEAGPCFFDVSGVAHKITQAGCVFRLDSSVFEDDVIILGSGSDTPKSYSWTKVTDIIGDVVGVTGTNTGFAVIVGIEGALYLKNFAAVGCVTARGITSLPLSAKTGHCSIFHVDITKMSPKFVHKLFAEVSLVLKDLLIVSRNDGFIFLYPIVHDSKFAEPVEIYWDKETALFAEVLPGGKGLIFIFKSGKVVFVLLDNFKIMYKVYYLSCDVTIAALLSLEESFYVFCSNRRKMFYFGPVNLENLNIVEYESKLRGIVSLSVLDKFILAGNVINNFYKISFDDDSNSPTICSLAGLKSIKEVGSDVEKLKTELNLLNIKFEALKCQQTDASQINVKLSGETLNLENLSSKTFAKDIWFVQIESGVNNTQYVKKYHLDNDFSPTSAVTLAINYFTSLNCVKLTVSLVGVVEDTSNFVFLNVSSITLAKKSENSLKQEIQKMLAP